MQDLVDFLVIHVRPQEGLLVPAIEARVQHDQRQKIAIAKVPENACALALRIDAYRHPLYVCAGGSIHSRIPAAVLFIVILCTIAPGVIAYFVVVPHRDHRMRGMHGLQIRVGLVLGMPAPIVGERNDFVRWIRQPAELFRVLCRVSSEPVIVQVIAEVNDRIEVVTVRDLAVSVEIPVGIIGA